MSIFGGQTNKHTLLALNEQGTLAALYPSEQELWVYGPPVTDPYDQGVAVTTDSDAGGAPSSGPGTDPAVETSPWAPQSDRDVVALDDRIDAWMNAETGNAAPGEEWVNLTIAGKAGFGDWNEQPYYTGHSQIVVSNPGAEQGWGVGPARRWAHYPYSVLDNPTRNAKNHLRMGQLPWVYSEQNMLYYRTQLIWEQQWAPYKQRLPVNPVVNPPSSVPFTAVVPTYGGGPIAYPGLDIPAIDHGAGVMPDGQLSAGGVI